MPLFEVTVQWLSRRNVLVVAENAEVAEDEAIEVFRDDLIHHPPVEFPRMHDILITDVECVVDV